MKKINYLGILLSSIMLMTGCEKINTQMYEKDRAMANFTSLSKTHSFSKTGHEIDTIDVPFSINGLSANYTRSINFDIVSDSTTAVQGVDYTIISAEVLPNEFAGNIKVRAKRPADDTVEPRVYFRIVGGKDFGPGVGTLSDAALILTNKLTPPLRWNHEPSGSWVTSYYLGTYSTAYYKFVIAATGETEIAHPYAIPGYNGGVKWTTGFQTSFKARLQSKLKEYNDSIAPNVLLHDDGPAKGQPVVIGLKYII